MNEALIPGTNIAYPDNRDVLEIFRPFTQSGGGLTLSQICHVTGLESATVQNWIKRGFVPHPNGRRYSERHLCRILTINAVRDGMKIDNVGALLRALNGDVNDEGDDIIQERRLFELFCRVVRLTKNAPANVDSAARDACRLLTPEEKKYSDTLEYALRVMAYAYYAGKYKKEAELAFGKIKV